MLYKKESSCCPTATAGAVKDLEIYSMKKMPTSDQSTSGGGGVGGGATEILIVPKKNIIKDVFNKNLANSLIETLDRRLESEEGGDELSEFNRLIENAIHWCLVNGNRSWRSSNSSAFVAKPKNKFYRLCLFYYHTHELTGTILHETVFEF
jgi:hypothetical protein